MRHCAPVFPGARLRGLEIRARCGRVQRPATHKYTRQTYEQRGPDATLHTESGTYGCRRRAVSPSCAKEHSFQSCTNCLLQGTTCSPPITNTISVSPSGPAHSCPDCYALRETGTIKLPCFCFASSKLKTRVVAAMTPSLHPTPRQYDSEGAPHAQCHRERPEVQPPLAPWPGIGSGVQISSR